VLNIVHGLCIRGMSHNLGGKTINIQFVENSFFNKMSFYLDVSLTVTD
jgi:hypothetical protein